ncbi:MAG TPA: M23 family metallopeptidase [Anaerolineae bacterium]|nr:M23 family metallopeptidase [Anaerolineae bacterium]
MNDRYILLVAAFSISALATGCGSTDLQATSLLTTPSQTQTTIPATEDIPPTATPTITPTPTSTAIPISITDSLLRAQQSTPSSEPGARCGVVDTLDFPIDPPEAKNVRFGGQDFGVFRDAYYGYHAGEDWWGPGDRASSFGVPVHSIGHGVVTYAEPNGWGRDKGVIIIRHTFPDGSRILSFYGHLHPPSVTLRLGDCVARGDPIGQIGQPRSSPHLHFEIREHMPSSTGRGYWSSDPAKAGWKPPSQFIWTYRIQTSPGVEWLWSSANNIVQNLGLWNRDTVVAITTEEILGIDFEDGSLLWKIPISDQSTDALFDSQLPLIYSFNHRRELVAYEMSDLDSEDQISAPDLPIEPIWEIPLGSSRAPTLLPLPNGGIAVAGRDRILGVSSSGELLWQHNPFARPMDWALMNGQLFLTTTGRTDPIWTIDENGPTAWEVPLSGHLAVHEEKVWIYADDGIYLLDMEHQSADLIYSLPNGMIRLGDTVALPNGNVLVDHTDISDRRLMLIGSNGELRWQRSYSGILQGELSLIELGGTPYLVTQDETNLTQESRTTTWREIIIYSVDIHSGDLTLVFHGGTRDPDQGSTSILTIGDDRILINLWGTTLLVLNPRIALETNTR